jgi:hypothetical protein
MPDRAYRRSWIALGNMSGLRTYKDLRGFGHTTTFAQTLKEQLHGGWLFTHPSVQFRPKLTAVGKVALSRRKPACPDEEVLC